MYSFKDVNCGLSSGDTLTNFRQDSVTAEVALSAEARDRVRSYVENAVLAHLTPEEVASLTFSNQGASCGIAGPPEIIDKIRGITIK